MSDEPIKIEKKKESFTIPFGHLKLQEKVNFSRHLAIIIKAGLPLFDGLKIIRRQTKSKTLRRVLDQLVIDVNNGQSLANSLRRYRNIFGDFFGYGWSHSSILVTIRKITITTIKIA